LITPPPPDLALPPAERMALYVQTLGRGPGRGRALTREEARDAFAIMLAGQADPHQVGALLMLLRYRGEAVDEMTGMVEAIRSSAGVDCAPGIAADLDWPSYGSGKTRGAPWFLLAALALARSGCAVAMHGSNEFSQGISVADALAALAIPVADSLATARTRIARTRFAYLPLAAVSPLADHLLNLRGLLGLRSPVNTAGRLLNPLNAPASIDGVFHPPYIDLHLGVAAARDQGRLLVIKGSGGEAERNPVKPLTAHLWQRGHGRSEIALPAVDPGLRLDETKRLGIADLVAIWRGDAVEPGAVATVIGTIAAGLLATGRVEATDDAAARAATIWENRHGGQD
jgi:anthranilate phosphoribosyltransferase